MTTYLQRQISNLIYVGQHTSIAEATVIRGRMHDAPRKYQLKLSSGDAIADVIKLDSGDTEVIELPENYTSASRLGIYVKTNALLKITINSPTHGSTNVALVRGTNGTTSGEHAGFFAWQGDVTTLTFNAPDADNLVTYFLYKIPDLTAAASYRDGARTLGVVS